MRKTPILTFLIILLLTNIAYAQNKTALVIGNGSYKHFSPLSSPKNEAVDMQNALKRLGFDVILLLDGTEDSIIDAVADFENRLRSRGGLALFHYGGHGVQVKGTNYIIPVEADIPDEKRVKSRAVEVDEIISAMDASGSKTNIVILDACRDNPLPGASRSGTRGLAVTGHQPPDSIIVYSADAGTTAKDGLFTPTLLKYLETPGMKFTDILKRVRGEVRKKSGGKQRTGDYNQLESDIYLAGRTGSSSSSSNSYASASSKKPSLSVESAKYGSVKLSVKEAGDLYLDGVNMGKIAANRSATLNNIETGSHAIEIKYAGNTERKTVTVYENRTASLSFSYKKAFALPSASSKSAGINMVFVEGGTFQMGSNDISRAKPVHSVTVSSFYIGKNEITQGEYRSVTGKSPSIYKGDSRPVENVSWYDAVEFCNALSKREGLSTAYNINKGRQDSNNKSKYDEVKWTVTVNLNANGYRLPTEAEWEYAARGGKRSKGYKFAGGDAGWNIDNSGRKTHEVRKRSANEIGLYDMSGNVSEWCWNWYRSYSSSSQKDLMGPGSGTWRVLRGGCFDNDASDCHLASRHIGDPDQRGRAVGFRVLRPAVQ